MTRGRIDSRRLQRDDENSRSRRATVAVIATCAVLLLGAVKTEPVHAGNYVMRSCNVPGQPYAPLGPWTASSHPPELTVVDACSAGGGVGFSFSGARTMLPESPWARVEIAKPVTGPQSEIRLVSVSMWYAARFGGSGQEIALFAADKKFANNTSYVHWLVTGRPGAESLSFERTFNRADTDAFWVGVYCGPVYAPFPPEPCVADHATPFHVRGMEVTLSEDKSPTVLQPAGTLLARGPQSGVRTLSYNASDLHSGLARVDVMLGDTVVKRHDLTPQCFYSDFTVCPTSDAETLEVDTRLVPNGSYNLALRVRDAAGNEQVVHAERTIEVANVPPSTATSAVPYTITASFKGSSRSKLTVPYGRRVAVRGRVTRGSQSAAGTRIEVLERLDRRGARERSTRKVTTKADGSFSIGLATSRPSRAIRLAYRPAGGRQAISRTLKLRVRAASRVSASLRGRVVRFSGKVLSGPVPRKGKRVLMEGRSPGSAWTAFKVLRTNRNGQFSGTYRLRVRRPGVVLKVRAVVPSEDGYGYLGSRSRAVTLRVR